MGYVAPDTRLRILHARQIAVLRGAREDGAIARLEHKPATSTRRRERVPAALANLNDVLNSRGAYG